ncbi:nucleoside hydrolase [Roseiterribacter gracilis]
MNRVKRTIFWLAALALLALDARGAATTKLVYFDNDFIGPGQSNLNALIPLLRDPTVKLLGVGVVVGDAWVKEETAHALRLLEIAGRTDVPVLEGAAMPLKRTQAEMRDWEARYGRFVWKGAWNAPREGRTYHPDDPDLIPPSPAGAPTTKAAREDAVSFLVRSVREHPGEVTIIACGPLTNIALALRSAPDVAQLAKEIVIQGGYVDTQMARATGHADYAVDFNFIFDPEAAHEVLTAPWQRITMVGDFANDVPMTTDYIDAIKRSGSPVAAYVAAYARRDQPMWDEIAVAVALDRSLVKRETLLRMDVDISGGPGYGETRVWREELAPGKGEQTVHMVRAIDVPRFLAGFARHASQ